MKSAKNIKFIATCLTLTGASAVFANPGHGISGTHWHATDAWGFAALGLMLALAIWLTRR